MGASGSLVRGAIMANYRFVCRDSTKVFATKGGTDPFDFHFFLPPLSLHRLHYCTFPMACTFLWCSRPNLVVFRPGGEEKQPSHLVRLLTACQILADNAFDGFLTTDQAGEQRVWTSTSTRFFAIRRTTSTWGRMRKGRRSIMR